MNDDDALPFEMRQLPGHQAPPTLDDETADRLLAGRLDPADAPPGYAAVAKLVTAATAPASTEELAGAPAAAARFAAAARSGFPTPAPGTRHAGVPRRPHSVKVAAAVLAALLSVGGVAAAAGVFPAPAKPAADRGPRGGGGKVATTARRDAATTTTTAATAVNQARGGSTGTGPDATGPAKEGLCRAWQAARGQDKQDGDRDDKKDRKKAGKRQDSTAFRALAAAAGGADRIAAYCQATPPADPPGRGNGDGNGNGDGDDNGGGSSSGD
jgi:hypothetical protein